MARERTTESQQLALLLRPLWVNECLRLKAEPTMANRSLPEVCSIALQRCLQEADLLPRSIMAEVRQLRPE